jgi:hypothetical protein
MDWTASSTKEGDKVFVTLPPWKKRRWWQLWRPRWMKGPVEEKCYTVVPVSDQR